MLSPPKFLRNIIVESHPQEYTGYPFVALIQHKSSNIIAIIDNVSDKNMRAYVLDLCEPEGINEASLIDVAAEWFEAAAENYPISVEFSKRGLTPATGRIYRTFNLDTISRIIGHVSYFPIDQIYKIKRRKKREIPRTVRVIHRSLEETDKT